MTTKEGRRMARARWSRERAAVPEPEASARARRLRALADRAEIDTKARRGELVERAKVERAVFELARRYRDALLAWPARVAAPIAAKLGADPHTVEAALGSEVRRHLEELSRDPLPRFGEPAG
jgi:hypothetical protein